MPWPHTQPTRTPDVLIVANLGLGRAFQANAWLYLRAARALVERVAAWDLAERALDLDDPPRARLVLLLDKDASTAEALRSTGATVINAPEAILACDDKRRTAALLAAAGVATPRTVLLPPLYPKQPLGDATLREVVRTLGLPVVVKEAKGSFGAQVHLAETYDDLVAIASTLADRRLLAQTFVASSAGRDRRLQVVDGEVVAAMERRAIGDFRANLSAGGVGYPYLPSAKERTLAIEAARAVGARNAGIDLLLDEGGEGSLVCEVNSNAHIWRLTALSGIDVAYQVLRRLLRGQGR